MKTQEQLLKLLSTPCDMEIEGFRVRIESDSDPQNPRKEFDNVGKMVCWHPRYDLGDEQIDRNSAQEYFNETVKPIIDAGGVYLPLYLYDHSGITMSTRPFSCKWDSGQVGFMYVTKEQIDKEWDGDVEKAKKYLEGEVKTYDQYLTNDVWGFTIEDIDGPAEESCWGFFGSGAVEAEVVVQLLWLIKARRKRLAAERKAERERKRVAQQCGLYVGG